MEHEVNQKDFANIIGITDRQVRTLKAEYGLFTRADGKKKYILEKCVPEYLNFKIESETTRGVTFNKEKEQAEHEAIKREISKLKLKKLRGELHRAVDVECFLTDMLVNFKNRLAAIPANVTPCIIGETDPNIIRDILDKEIIETLAQLSEYDPMKIDTDEAVSFELDEEDGDD